MKLESYRKKRKATETNEPFGHEPADASQPTKRGLYVVHLHQARRTHYDLRIQIGQVLASFAVPKGPTLDPDARHLAVHTEDHPIEYLDFEDVIPKGNYGAGPMIAWDRGRVEYLETSVEEGVKTGKIDFVLTGFKLRGRFALVHLKKTENEWLLLKKKDGFENSSFSIDDEPQSIFSGLTVDELNSVEDIRKTIDSAAKSVDGAHANVPKAFDLSPIASADADEILALPRKSWTFLPTLPGVRVLVRRDGEDVTLLDHKGKDIRAYYPEVARAARLLPSDSFALDAEIVAFEPTGLPSGDLLVKRAALFRSEGAQAAMREFPVICLVHDALTMAGFDLTKAAFVDRRQALTTLVRGKGMIRFVDDYADAKALHAFTLEHANLGILAKQKKAAYAEGGRVFTKEAAPAIHHDVPRAKDAVKVTNRDKIFFPEDGYTKGDLCDYYEEIAPWMLTYLKDRPITLVRYPDGIHGKFFFQWNVPPNMPTWVRSLEIGSDDDKKRVFIVNDARSLVFIANLGCIPVHLLACRAQDTEFCDFATIDFDIKDGSFLHAVKLANALRKHLEAIGLPGYPKTSGQTGLHVLIPLGEGVTFEVARQLADLLAGILVEEYPEIATVERIISKRAQRIYIDTGQTGRTRTIVAPYSVRASPGATVSTPLDWSEVTEKLDTKKFTIRTVLKRLEKKDDPMRTLLTEPVDIATAVQTLSQNLPTSAKRGRSKKRE